MAPILSLLSRLAIRQPHDPAVSQLMQLQRVNRTTRQSVDNLVYQEASGRLSRRVISEAVTHIANSNVQSAEMFRTNLARLFLGKPHIGVNFSGIDSLNHCRTVLTLLREKSDVKTLRLDVYGRVGDGEASRRAELMPELMQTLRAINSVTPALGTFELNFALSHDFTDADAEAMSSLAHLTSLTVLGDRITVQGATALARLGNAKEIYFQHSTRRVSPDVANVLDTLPNIRYVSLPTLQARIVTGANI